MRNDITARELFDRVGDILQQPSDVHAASMMHDVVVQVCAYALRDTRHGFGNLMSQVEYICRRLKIPVADTVAIHRMRRHSNSAGSLPADDVRYDCRALCLLISAVFKVSVPSDISSRIPHHANPADAPRQIDWRYIRCTVSTWDDNTIVASPSNDEWPEPLRIGYNSNPEYADHSYLRRLLREGMQLNLLDCRVEDGLVQPGYIVVEPDYLVDISAIAGCFEDFGHHPLLYTLNRMKPKPNTRHTLLGNFAGRALDDIINNPHYTLADTVRSNFRDKAVEYATCNDLDIAVFHHDAATQVGNIRQVADVLFTEYDRHEALLEPSFVCEALGLNGRVDLMTTDCRLLVEQKSGRNIFIERARGGRYGNRYVEKHFVQVMLYYGILHYNFKMHRSIDVRLLYSRYAPADGLLQVEPLMALLREALKFRNLAVATEYFAARRGFDHVIPSLQPAVLNTEGMDGDFFRRYLLPQMEEITLPLTRLTPVERAYFCRMMTFAMKEQLMQKVGAQEGHGNCAADLWNMPLAQKRETGNIYTGLTIVSRERSTSHSGIDTIRLAVPDYGDDFLPNFRRGDMVYLYRYYEGETPDVRRAILFKGAMAEIRVDSITVSLNNGQQNAHIFDDDTRRTAFYAVEHGSSDIGSSAAMAGLHCMLTTSQRRRDLLLANRDPERDTSRRLSRSYDPTYDNILLRAKQANDYFLLVGPPGTGKTSMALRYLVEEELTQPDASLLLMSYTNRAVDEICAMLCTAGIGFIRMGSALSCDPAYRPYLIGEAVEQTPTLSAIRQRIAGARVVVCTTSAMSARPFLFAVKRFSTAIIDEASQILEPNIIGLLSAHATDANAVSIGRFILIGDHKQLPAVVQQSEEESAVSDEMLRGISLYDCRDSLFERLLRHERSMGRERFIGILRRQGRMHPEIAEFPNRMFYSRERLEPVPCPHQLETALAYDAPAIDATDTLLKRHRMIFIPSRPCRTAGASEKVNTEEARIVANLLRRIHRFYGEHFNPSQTVGVIVPYRNQISMIRREIGRLGIAGLEDISIDTVERYQGSQRDVIIYSFTIHSRYQLDFLTANSFVEDGHIIDRKLNVAITRAKKQMIMTGNTAILNQNTVFKALISHIRERGGYADNIGKRP